MLTRQFAATLLNHQTGDEYMVVGNTAEEAEAYGTQEVRNQAAKGVMLEMIVGSFGGSSYPTGQIVKLKNVL